MPNQIGIDPMTGIAKAMTATMARNPMSRRLSFGSRRNDGALVPEPRAARRATSRATITTSGQPKPRRSRFDPVMFAAANGRYSGSEPERNA